MKIILLNRYRVYSIKTKNPIILLLVNNGQFYSKQNVISHLQLYRKYIFQKKI